MGFFNLNFRDQLTSPVQEVAKTAIQDELDNLVATVSGWAASQHNADGTHSFAGTGANLVPTGGTIQWHSGVTTPTGWLLCDGTNASRTSYPALFKVIGITYGAGDSINTFGLPSLNGGTPKYIILAV